MLAGAGGSSSNDLPNAESKFLYCGTHLSRCQPPPPAYSAMASQQAAMGSCSPAILYSQGGSGVQPSPAASVVSDPTLGMNSPSGSTLASNLLPSFASQFLVDRPSMPTSFFGTPLQQVQFSSGLPQNISNPQPSVSSMQPRPPPRPPPPPQQPQRSQTLQQLGAIQLPQQDQPLSFPQSAMLSQVPLQFRNQLSCF
ncbi:hypothetical protein ACP70R_001450 [Stipagrostis hirtigluma subsp. patula]